MSKLRIRLGIAFACSALLVIASMTTALAAEPSKVHPNDSGMYHVCLVTTEFSNPHQVDATFSGTMKNNCGDDATSPGLTLTITPSEICIGHTSFDPARRTTVTLTNGQQRSYSSNITARCVDCDDSAHKVVGTPSYQLGAKVSLSGRTNLGTLVKANDAMLYATVSNNPALLGTPC